MPRQRSEKTTPLSEWLDRNQDKVSRADFAQKVHLDDRQNLDRYFSHDPIENKHLGTNPIVRQRPNARDFACLACTTGERD